MATVANSSEELSGRREQRRAVMRRRGLMVWICVDVLFIYLQLITIDEFGELKFAGAAMMKSLALQVFQFKYEFVGHQVCVVLSAVLCIAFTTSLMCSDDVKCDSK